MQISHVTLLFCRKGDELPRNGPSCISEIFLFYTEKVCERSIEINQIVHSLLCKTEEAVSYCNQVTEETPAAQLQLQVAETQCKVTFFTGRIAAKRQLPAGICFYAEAEN